MALTRPPCARGAAWRCRGACELRRARRVVSPHEQPTSACAKAWRSRMVNEAAAYWGSGRSSSASARSAGSSPPGVHSQARIGLVAAGGLVQPPVFAARGGGQGGGELPCDAAVGEAGEAGAPLGSVAADGLGEPDAGLLQRVVGGRPREIEARGLTFEQPLVAAQQPPKGELVAGLGGRDQPAPLASQRPRAGCRHRKGTRCTRTAAAAPPARGPLADAGRPSCTRMGKRKVHHLPRRLRPPELSGRAGSSGQARRGAGGAERVGVGAGERDGSGRDLAD
jgi:hypothetical protein